MNENLYLYNFHVTHVRDGDSAVGDIDLGFYHTLRKAVLRFAHINTAEMKGEDKEAGLVAKNFVVERILNKDILIKVLQLNDKYGRIVAEVYYQDETSKVWINLNQELIEKGLAVPFMTEV